MNAGQIAAMAEATRLTRQGRLVEATALIQQTLAGPAATRRPPDAPWAAEETAGTPGRDPGSRPALRAGAGTRPGLARSGWLPRRRALPSQGPGGLRRLHRPASPVVTPPPGRFGAFSYTNAAGTRAYRLYVPASGISEALPLIVMLHGGTQDAATFAAATGMNDLAEGEKFLVVYPEQARSANAGRYWNWFAPGHQRRDAGGTTPQSDCAAYARRPHTERVSPNLRVGRHWRLGLASGLSRLTASRQRRMYYRYYVSGALMRLNSKGQVTIPAALRERHGLHEGDEVDVIEDGNTLRIVQVKASPTRGQRLVRRMRGRASTTMSTDQLMELLRGE